MTAEQELDEILRNVYRDKLKQELLDWHERHSGRPTREQLWEAIRRNIIGDWMQYNRYSDALQATFKDHMLDAILNLYALNLYAPAPASERGQTRRVIREEIEDVFSEYGVKVTSAPKGKDIPKWSGFIDDLLALLNNEGGKAWCSHTRWDKFKDGDGSWYLKETPDSEEVCVPKHWDICPVAGCHARRPSE